MQRSLTTSTILRAVLITAAIACLLYLLVLLRGPISWVVIAAFIGIGLSGPVNLLAERVPRWLAIALVYIVLILIPVGIGLIVVPPFIRQADDLISALPDYAREVTDFVQRNETLARLEADYDITGKLESQAASLPTRIGDAAGTLQDVGVGIVNSIFAAVTIIILSLFIVVSGRGWTERAIGQFPQHQQARLRRTLDNIASAVGGYIGGAIAQACVAGVTSFIVLSILGVSFAGPLAVILALLDLIPLVGATIGGVLVGIVTLFHDFPTATIVWGIWMVLYQLLENNVIQPQIQGRAVKVNAFVVLVSVLCGSELVGVGGALLAIPAAASLQIILGEWWSWRREMRELSITGGLVPTAPAAPAVTGAAGGQGSPTGGGAGAVVLPGAVGDAETG